MRGRKIEEIDGSARRMYIRNTADITPKWKGIRNADIIPNWSDICNTADIPKLNKIFRFLWPNPEQAKIIYPVAFV